MKALPSAWIVYLSRLPLPDQVTMMGDLLVYLFRQGGGWGNRSREKLPSPPLAMSE